MKKAIKDFYHSNEKKNNKLLKKLFGCKDLAGAIKLEESIRKELEMNLKKEVELITFPDVKNNGFLMYNFAKYKTLKSIIDLILDNRTVYMYSQDYLEVSK